MVVHCNHINVEVFGQSDGVNTQIIHFWQRADEQINGDVPSDHQSEVWKAIFLLPQMRKEYIDYNMKVWSDD